jgi:hypothetical protein
MIVVVVLVAFVFGELSLVFGMRSQWQVGQSHKTPGGAGVAIAGWICGVCGLAVLVLWLLVTLVPTSP